MSVPLVILAVGAAVAGFVGVPPEQGWFHHLLEPVFEGTEHHEVSLATTLTFGVVSTLVALAGLYAAAAAYVFRSVSPAAVAERLGPLYRLAYNKWYFDDIYQRLIVEPARGFAVFLWRQIDVGVIDAAVNGAASLVVWTSQLWRRAQTGLVANYVLAIALGTVIIVGAYLVAGSNLFR